MKEFPWSSASATLPVQSLRDSAKAATPVGGPALRRRFRNDDGLGVVAVCSEGGCRREVLTTGVVRHACRHRVTARGALIFCFGGFFHTLGSGWHERVRGGGFNPLRGATTGVVMRRRATSGEMARGGFWFGGFFCGWTGSGCGGMCWPVDRPATHAAAGAAARGALIFLLWGVLSHAREWTARGLMRFKTAKFYGPSY